jgi:hypothetical protein
MSPTRTLLLTLAIVVSGCASLGEPRDRGERDLLTRAQLEAVDHLSAYDAIRRYRPLWLRTQRGQDSFLAQAQARRGLRVYVDRVHFGGVESLRDLDVRNIQEIRFLDKRKATLEFGTDHSEGAILVKTRS